MSMRRPMGPPRRGPKKFPTEGSATPATRGPAAPPQSRTHVPTEIAPCPWARRPLRVSPKIGAGVVTSRAIPDLLPAAAGLEGVQVTVTGHPGARHEGLAAGS